MAVLRRTLLSLGLLVGLVGCPATPQPTPASTSSAPMPRAGAPSAGLSGGSPRATPSAISSGVAVGEPKPKTAIRAAEASRVLFLKSPPAEAVACRSEGEDADQIRCMLGVLYAKDKVAKEAALALYDEAGIVAGVEPRQTMDGGWRGMLELVPEPPLGRHRRHLVWLLAAYRHFASFFDGLEERAGKRAQYRYAPVRLRFFRSVGRTTPSAYASGWTVAYNVSGSLHSSKKAVRETMFHETFHLNDKAHGNWSAKALTKLYDEILDGCTKNKLLSTPCLRPYAPNDTMVRGGTFYAFQPGNGVWEYTAELAIRYYREHQAMLANKKLAKPAFKCGPKPNGTTWKMLVDEFFGGVDLVPDC